MNKNDLKLILFIIIVSLIGLLTYGFMNNSSNKEALVYYQNSLILTIDLNQDSEYTVNAKNGEVKIITSAGKIKVVSENSPLHICSRQGWISKSYETIVCLPNELVIKIKDVNTIDTIIK